MQPVPLRRRDAVLQEHLPAGAVLRLPRRPRPRPAGARAGRGQRRLGRVVQGGPAEAHVPQDAAEAVHPGPNGRGPRGDEPRPLRRGRRSGGRGDEGLPHSGTELESATRSGVLRRPRGGKFVAFYRSRSKADARCAVSNAAYRGRGDYYLGEQFDTEGRKGATEPHRTGVAETPFFEVVEIDFEGPAGAS